MRYVVFSRVGLRGRRWYWHLRAGNGEIVATGEGYRNRADARHAVDQVKRSGDARVEVRG